MEWGGGNGMGRRKWNGEEEMEWGGEKEMDGMGRRELNEWNGKGRGKRNVEWERGRRESGGGDQKGEEGMGSHNIKKM